MNINDSKLILRVAKKYYELKMNQEEIAAEENISKSKVSRLLKKAMDNGYINFNINYQIKSVSDLEEEIKKCFNIKNVFICPVIVNNDSLILNDVCKALARDLNKIIKDNDTIGVSWGKTMNCLAKNLEKIDKKNIKVVQLNGGIAKNITSTESVTIVENFTKACDGVGYLLPVPAIVDNKKIADAIMEDSQIKNVLDLGKNSRVAIFSVGNVLDESILIEAKYFTLNEYRIFRDIGIVGDICTRYFDINGRIIKEDLNHRIIGITLEELKKKKVKIGIGVGITKAKAILGALMGNYINTLYIDELTAQEVLKLYYENFIDCKEREI